MPLTLEIPFLVVFHGCGCVLNNKLLNCTMFSQDCLFCVELRVKNALLNGARSAVFDLIFQRCDHLCFLRLW